MHKYTKYLRAHNARGFTLVEIMIVVAIIALLAAIAIPNLLRAQLNANETSAIAFLRTWSAAQAAYRLAQTPSDYGTCAELTTANPPYVNETCAAEVITRTGYTFTNRGNNANTYCMDAVPDQLNVTGGRTFGVDAGGRIWSGSGGAGTEPDCSAAAPWVLDGQGALIE
jgi:type IV pilus assembly protein PilA